MTPIVGGVWSGCVQMARGVLYAAPAGRAKSDMTVRKAIIPTAGRGIRLRPWTFGCPKAMLPLVDARGRIRPVLHWILAEAAAAGISEAALIVSPQQCEVFERYLPAVRNAGANGLPERVEIIIQPAPAGFGDAVLRGRSWAAGESAVAVMLGDHVYTHGSSGSCLGQLLKGHDPAASAATVGMQVVGAEELLRVGVARGEPIPGADERVYLCKELVEKPSLQLAGERLVTPGLPEGKYLGHAGLYVFSPEIFDVLSSLASAGTGGELEMTDAQAELLRRHPRGCRLVLLDGSAHDTGTPAGYADTFAAFAAGNRR